MNHSKSRVNQRFLSNCTTRRLLCVMLCLPLLLLWRSAAASAERTLVDDFSATGLDFTTWSSTANLREIVDGRLVLKAGSAAGTGSRTRLRTRSTALSSLAATVTVENVEIEAGSWSMVRLEGIYYNVLSASPTDYTGDIWAAIFIGERGNGLEAWWEVWESLNSGFTDDVMRDGGTLVLPGVLTIGTAYQAKIEYDGNTQFTFTLGANVANGNGPPRMGGPSDGYQEFSTRVYAGGSVHATLDDTVADDVVSDDFSASMIDENKWHHLERARIVEDDSLRLDVRGVDLQPDNTSQVSESLKLEANPDYVEAQITVSLDSDLDDGLLGRAGLTGVFYNHERDGGTTALPYDGLDGDAAARVQLELKDGILVAAASIEHVTAADNSSTAEVFREQFVAPLNAGRQYLVWIMRDGDTMTFGIDEDTIEYEITTSTYAPSPDSGGGYRSVVTGIEGSATSDPGGADGIFRASVDDVYLGSPASSGGNGDSLLSAVHPLAALPLIAAVLILRRLRKSTSSTRSGAQVSASIPGGSR